MTAPTHPGDRPSLRTFVSALAVTGVLSALVVCAAVAVAPGSLRTPLAWGAGTAAVVLSAAVATAAHTLRAERTTRRRLQSVTQDIGRLLQQQARTTEEARQEQQRLIDELAQQRTELTESFAAERDRLEEEGTRERDRLREENARLSGELERARRERATALSATANAAARMQALATATLADLRAMEDRHTDEDVLADLLHLDHRTAQAGRLADSVAVLTGARSGRRWARPIGMESILRGAMGRIAGYRRVRVHSASEAAVTGHAAEGVMHALAELLDNAANFSPPTAEVHVYVEEVPAGVIVSVEDSGLVMGEVQLRRAERAVSGDVTGLGGLTGTRLGLAVVGRLARKHGLKVSFRPSARGGTGVLMLIPQSLLASPAPAEPATAAPRPQTGPSTAAAAAVDTAVAPAAVDTAADHGSAAPPEPGPAGLPRRRRGRTLAAAERARSAPGTAGHRSARPADEHRTPPAAELPRTAQAGDEGRARAARFSSFRQAVRPPAPGTGQPGQAPAASPADTARDEPAGVPAPFPAGDGHSAGAPRATPPADPATAPARDHQASDPTHATAPDERGAVPVRDSRTADAPHGPAPDGQAAEAPSGTAPARPSADDSPHGAVEHSSPAPSHPHAHPEGDTTS